MSGPVVVFWLAGGLSPSAHEEDLRSWAEARLVRLDEPGPELPLSPAEHDAAASSRVEALLGDARTALFGTDHDAVRRALDEAERTLDGAPQLPESAFLRAELFRTRAVLVAETDAAAARALLRAAEDLDGETATAFQTRLSAAGSASPSAASPRPAVPLLGPRPGDVVYLDGLERRGPLVARPGGRHVRILRGDRVAWSGWVTVGEAPLDLPMVPAPACSEGDLSGVGLHRSRLQVPDRVQCGEWVAVRSIARNRIEVARCRGSACGPLLPWSRDWGSDFTLPATPAWPEQKANSWLLWTAAGVLTSAATGVALWRAGAFEREGPRRERFEFVPPGRP